MSIGRRTVCGAALAALAIRSGWARSVEDHGLFWSMAPPNAPRSIAFGYARVAAAAAPSVVSDGQRFALQCGGLIGDVANGRLPSVFLDPDKLRPLYDRIPPDLAGQLRAILAASVPQLPNADKISGLEAVILLMAEGQPAATLTVGGAIVAAARTRGRPFTFLFTPEQYQALYRAPDIAALDGRVTVTTVDYLLKLRARVGPIGSYLATLYTSRRIAALSKQGDELTAHGVVGFADYSGLPADRLKAQMVDRALKAMQSATVPCFFTLPIGVLDEPDGIIATARTAGWTVELLA